MKIIQLLKEALQKQGICHPELVEGRTSNLGHRTPDSRIKTKPSHRAIALFFVVTFLNTLVPYNQLWANNNGPNAPEAAAFEPVDATDMVNLVTGDMSYVLPLLNIPSPEGGYPLALSYHAGIAMDQEASWVGLGWSLNPGAINRSVNGYPDDWGKTRVTEFFYDQGETKNYYSFSIGGTLPNGLTLGVSSAWGDYRAWGGVVGFAGVHANFGSEGVGLGANIPGTGLNMSLNYSGNNGLTGMVGVGVGSASGSMNFNFSTGESSANASVKAGVLGVGWNSDNGVSFSPVSITKARTNTSKNNYHIVDTDDGFNFNAVNLFWASYRHRRYSYSLYKNTDLFVSGTLNLYENSKNDDGSYTRHHLNFMDIKQYSADDYNTEGLIDSPQQYKRGLITAPNYDNYSVSAQGLSGTIVPQFFDEVRLYDKGFRNELYGIGHPSNVIRDWGDYLTNFEAVDADEYKLNNKINFYFKGGNSSFLRTQTGNFVNPSLGNPNTISDEEVLSSIYTQSDDTYSSNITQNGHLKTIGNRKRTGNYIETFTNEDILNNNTNGWFIAPNNFDRNFNDLIKNPSEGIGAYRVTTTDGKTYHYSLPVYHFESFYKNFDQIDNEYSSFFESKRTEPYATHWLLTAVTGPDYFDKNNNGRVDEEDYGYWVEFDYGKWSDGYAWRSPKVGFKELDENQTYFWGVKQIYYLDHIKTRTHTALFVKSIRDDNLSADLEHYKSKFDASNGLHRHAQDIKSKEYKDYIFREKLYAPNGTIHPYTNNIFSARKSSWKYIDIPENKTLKLDKIILLKNKDVLYDKNDSEPVYGQNRKLGISYYNEGFYNEFYQNGTVLMEKPGLASNYYPINQDNKVLDIADVRNRNLEEKAQKIIKFEHDYSLANDVPNAPNGRLTLKAINNKGKRGVNIIPPYVFTYDAPNTKYDFNNSDVWGYVDTNPSAWSLSSIKTPTGGEIDIEYEEDSFYAEAAHIDSSARTNGAFRFDDNGNNESPNSLSTSQISRTFGDKLVFDLSPLEIDYNLNSVFVVGDLISLKFNATITTGTSTIYFRRQNDWYTIADIISNERVVLEKNSLTKHYSSFTRCLNVNNEDECSLSNVILEGKDGLYTTTDSNGRKGGGLRVKNILIQDGVKSYATSYDYTNPISNDISGITSYEPFDDNRLVPYIEEIPSPNVMYEYVTVSQLENNSAVSYNKTVYNFETLKPYNFSIEPLSDDLFDMGNAFKVTRSQEPTASFTDYSLFKNTIHDFTSSLGALVSVKSYNEKEQLLGATVNTYKGYNLDEDHSQGIHQNSFQTVKKIREYEYIYNNTGGVTRDHTKFYFNSSSKVEYPNVLESTTNIQEGFTNTTYYDKHDFLTGQVTETTSISSDGLTYKSKVMPAYYVSDYTNNEQGFSMGAKVDNPNNKNMLTQTAATFTQIKEGEDWKTTNASINTWNNDWAYSNYDGEVPTTSNNAEKIWRKHKTFIWKGELDDDGAYLGYTGEDDDFNWSDPESQTNSEWTKTSTVSLYDHYSMPLELEDINGNKASTKMGDENSKVFAVANAGYTEMYYSGAEDLIIGTNYFSGEVSKGSSAILSEDIYHTGSKAVQVSANVKAFSVSPEAGRYKVSVWAYKGSNSNYTNTKLRAGDTVIAYHPAEVIPAGDWVQLNFYTEDVGANQEVYVYTTSGTVIYDDFRMIPVVSSMTSYVYNEWDELTYTLGANNLATRYEYDAAGRLIRTYVEVMDTPQITGGFKLTKEINYNYGTTTN